MAKVKTKNKTPRRYYCYSEIFDSNGLPRFISDRLTREKCSYRRMFPLEVLTKSEIKEIYKIGRDVVQEKQPIIAIDEKGNQIESEMEIVSYDVELNRYYFEPKTLDELEDFISNLGIEVTLQTYDQEDEDCEPMEKYLESRIGMPLPEKCVLVSIQDSHFLEGECNCPKCKEERGEEPEE